ncbi:retrotransposon protein, putative, ty1-copia subclass [Tanacetum coccineum]
MAVAAQNTNNSTIKSILQAEKLNGPNFTNWFWNLRVVLRSENKLAHLEQPLIPLPFPVASQAARDAYDALFDAQNEVTCLMLGSMSPDLQRALENYKAYDMIQELKTMFEEQAKQDIIGKTIAELHAMLKLHEKGIPKKAETPAVLAIRGGKIQKNNKKKLQRAKGKTKLTYAPKPMISPPPKRDNLTKDSICHHCKEGLRRRRKLKHGALNLYVGNRMRATVEAIGSFDLILLNGLVIVLDCVVFVSHLVDNGYMHKILNYGIYVMKDGLFYFNAIPRDDIYEIDMKNLYPNASSTYNVSNKRAKRTLDSSYLWHCRIGHINKKRTEKLQRDGILQPTNDETFDTCKSCISGKMARKPFPHQSFWGYALEFAARILNMVPTKKVHKTSYTTFKDTREQHDEVKHKEVEPHSEKVPICRFERISQAPDMYGFYVNAEEHELRDLNEPPNYKIENSKSGNVPMQGKPNLSKVQGTNTPDEMKHVQRVTYALAIRSIMYEVRYTRPDVTFAEIPEKVEYKVVTEASMEVVWMRKFIDGLGNVVPTNKRPMEILCDNTGAISIVKDPRIMKRAIHYQRKYHYIREVI